MDLESIQITPAGRRRVLKVVVDADGGVGLDDMAEISQALSAELDASGAMGDARYTLEVSSPGVNRPLTEPRHWRRAAGRLVSVPFTGQRPAREPAGESAPEPAEETERRFARTLHGRVVTAGEDGVVLDIDSEHRTFGYSELGPGRIELEFGRGDKGERDGH
jgi:ribosome maturation factor RimP